MGEYFKPLRRKIGVLTLVMALMFTAGWVRSKFSIDGLIIPRGKYTKLTCCSANQSLVWFMQQFDYPHAGLTDLQWISAPIANYVFKLDDGINFKWSFQCLGFHIGESEHIEVMFQKIAFVIIPYWSITVPLTLISLWLLFKKPREANQEKSGEATANEGV